MEFKSKHDAVVELVNKLFIYTDFQYWDKLLSDVFKEEIRFDMSSMGGATVKMLPASEVCSMWETGFADIDYVHHQSGNFIVNFIGETEADVFCYAIASHFREAAINGKTREFVGSYDIHVTLTDIGWRIDGFRYVLKYITGNRELK